MTMILHSFDSHVSGLEYRTVIKQLTINKVPDTIADQIYNYQMSDR